jgi:hypothetical protein
MNDLVRKGKIGEHQVIAELLKRNWDVYYSICDDHGIDLLIEKNNKFLKIQVKTSTRLSPNGRRYSFGLGNTDSKPDFYICVIPEGFLIVKENQYSGKAFFWYPKTLKRRLQEFYNNWGLLEQ